VGDTNTPSDPQIGKNEEAEKEELDERPEGEKNGKEHGRARRGDEPNRQEVPEL